MLSKTFLTAFILANGLAKCHQPPLEHSPAPRNFTFKQLDFTSPAPHIFAGARDLLQQWPSTYAPNGHSIVPCAVPPFTPLYHGRLDANAPSSPEWLAFDAAVAYGIMGGTRESHLWTYQTARELRCVYFDGMSAALVGAGRVDAQMVLLYGNVTGPRDGGAHAADQDEGPDQELAREDYRRARGLCAWLRENGLGGPEGIEGVVRMSAGFELIMCDMESPSLRLIHHINVTAPLNEKPLGKSDERRPSQQASKQGALRLNDPAVVINGQPGLALKRGPFEAMQDPNDDTYLYEPFSWSGIWQWYTSITWYFGRSGAGPGRGETRVKPATCHLLSFYSPQWTSLYRSRAEHDRKLLNLSWDGYWQLPQKIGRSDALRQLTRRRREHTLASMSTADVASFRRAAKEGLSEFLRRDLHGCPCSGVDRNQLANTISQQYTHSLPVMVNILKEWKSATAGSSPAAQRWLDVARDHAHSLLFPYFEYLAGDSRSLRAAELYQDLARESSAYSRCRSSWTALIAEESDISLNKNEQLLKWAFEETLDKICSIALGVSLSIESEWQSYAVQPFNLEATKGREAITTKIQDWIEAVEVLIAWLGWTGDTTTCTPSCRWDEICYIPFWPLYDLGKHGLPPTSSPHHLEEEALWLPKCVKATYISRGDS